jgi:hypothetical protein
MNKTLDEAVESLKRWYDEGMVGNITFFRAPRAEHVGCIVEQTVKYYEMPPKLRNAFAQFCNTIDVDRGEFWRDRDGSPDRVKIVGEF